MIPTRETIRAEVIEQALYEAVRTIQRHCTVDQQTHFLEDISAAAEVHGYSIEAQSPPGEFEPLEYLHACYRRVRAKLEKELRQKDLL